MGATIVRVARQLLCCLVVVSFISATSLPPRQARADGGTGGDPVTTAVVVLTTITLLSMTQMPFLRGFQPFRGPVLVALLILNLQLRTTMLQMLAIRPRSAPLLLALLETTVLFATAISFVALTRAVAQRRAMTQAQFILGGFGLLFWSPLYAFQPQRPVLGNTPSQSNALFTNALQRRQEVLRYGDGPPNRPAYRGLFTDADAGNPTAQAIVRLLPQYHSNGFRPGGSVIGQNGKLSVLNMPGVYLTPFGPAYDANYWDDIVDEAHQLASCEECYWDAEEDAYYGSWEAELALDIADDLLAQRYHDHHANDTLKLSHRIRLIDAIPRLKALKASGPEKKQLLPLGLRIRAAFAVDDVAGTEDAGPTWSVPFGFAGDLGDSKAGRTAFPKLPEGTVFLDSNTFFVVPEEFRRKQAVNRAEAPEYGYRLSLSF
jgi:hypothetical protein